MSQGPGRAPSESRANMPETNRGGYQRRAKKEIHEEHEGKRIIHEGPLRRWRRLKRDPPKVGKGVREGTLRG